MRAGCFCEAPNMGPCHGKLGLAEQAQSTCYWITNIIRAVDALLRWLECISDIMAVVLPDDIRLYCQITIKLRNLIKCFKKKKNCLGKQIGRRRDCRLIQLFLPYLEDKLQSVLGGIGSANVDLEVVLHKIVVRAERKLPLPL